MKSNHLKQRQSEESRNFDEMKKLPPALRDYYSNQSNKFDKLYNNRPTDSFLQRFRTAKYNIKDRTYGGPNEDIANIFFNILNDKEVQELIDDMIFNRKWIFHPIRRFENWSTIANKFYNDENLYWLLIIFNRIVDPFKALLDFNMVRVPNIDFLHRMPYRIRFDYSRV